MTPPLVLTARPLTTEAFAPFGDVIDARGPARPVNAGSAERYDALGDIAAAAGGRAAISLFVCRSAFTLPLSVPLLERHHLGSQAFVPCGDMPLVVVVAPDAPRPRASALRAFLATGGQGINYRPGVWHMPLTPLAPGRFLVVDRVGDQDCAIWPLDGTPIRVVGAA